MPVNGKFELMQFGDPKSFEPFISEKTILMHHGVHLATYVNNLNNLIAGTEWEGKSLEYIVKNAPEGPILNNAGQILNHNMYFEQFTLYDYLLDKPLFEEDKIFGNLIKEQFGDNFTEQINKAGLTLFGSGWVWLSVDDNGKLVITQEPNAMNPLRRGLHPLLTIDVWEHAYYLDYQSRRGEYLEKIWNVINPTVAARRYLEAMDALERTVSLK